MTERSILPVWRNSQFIHCSCASENDKGVNRMKDERTKYENVMAYIIKIFFFSLRKKLFIQTALKNLPNKYFNFGQLFNPL